MTGQGILRQVYAERDTPVVEREAMPDHVHPLVSRARNAASNSGSHRSRHARRGCSVTEFGHLRSRLPTLWTNSYFVATVGDATPEVVKRHVENQRNVYGTPLPRHG